jgi:hypothetical protein
MTEASFIKPVVDNNDYKSEPVNYTAGMFFDFYITQYLG